MLRQKKTNIEHRTSNTEHRTKAKTVDMGVGGAPCCVVTGASRGLGRAIAVELARRGWSVCVNFRENRDAAAETVAAVIAAGGDVFRFQADVRDREAVNAMFEEVTRRWGRLDLLVNNAGISRESLLLKMAEAEWDEVLGTNFIGALSCCRAAAELMHKAGGGQIINICSVSGVQGRAGQSHYAAAKGALIGLVQSLAAELGSAGIRVNAVLPGYLPTEMGLASPKAAEHARSRHHLGILADIQETAAFIANLAEMKWVTGQVLRVDGRAHGNDE